MARLELFFSASRSKRIAKLYNALSNNNTNSEIPPLFATQTVQVTSEATARPIMTAFTMVSACRNMPHGERSCGNCARLTDGSSATGLAEVPFIKLVSELGVAAFAGSSAASVAGVGEAPLLDLDPQAKRRHDYEATTMRVKRGTHAS